MLEGLKKDIAREKNSTFVFEAMTESMSDDDIKDAFLDDEEVLVLGAENDPEIAELADAIPEYDEDNQDIDAELENLQENFIPESKI